MNTLVLSGGGRKGAFQVGVIREWVCNQGREWDGYRGVSVGALAAAFMAQYRKGDINAIIDYEELWNNITGDRSIWKNWLIPYLPGALYRDSFMNSGPLRKLVERNLDVQKIKESGQHLRLGAVCLDTMEYVEATEKSDNLVEWVLASSAFPSMFLPIKIDGKLYTDGGVRRVTPLKGAIQDGIGQIDAVVCSPRRSTVASFDDNWLGTKVTALKVALRAIEGQGDELFLRDLDLCEARNEIGGRFKTVDLQIAAPERFFPGTALSFDRSVTTLMKQHGIEVAKKLTRIKAT